MKIRTKNYQVCFNENGSIGSLTRTEKPEVEWILPTCHTFGLPFVNGTQESETYLEGDFSLEGNTAAFLSNSEETSVRYEIGDEGISFTSRLPLYVGPRVGIDFSFHLLDSSEDDFAKQCMPHVIYTDEENLYCYLIFYNPRGGYLTFLVDTPFAAWRIKYSKNGHKMLGFQLLSEADDVVGKQLPIVRNLSGQLFFTDDLASAYEEISSILQVPIVSFSQSGALVGNTLPLTVYGVEETSEFEIISPIGKVQRKETLDSLELEEVGAYRVIAKNGDKNHETRVFSQESPRQTLERTSAFYRENFQDETGAFYRIIWSDTLSPKGGVTYEGIAFGDPHKMISCKTGEFGGFAGWLMIKRALEHTSDEKALQAARKYIESWALNLEHPDTPLPGSISHTPQVFGNRSFGAYHVYHDFNYPQYEIFLIEELVDYYRLTKNETVREMAVKIGLHFTEEHIHEDGYVWCQNKDTSVPRDYSTVHTPVTGLHKLAMIAPAKEQAIFLEKAEKLADHICERGLNFPTEGEQSTEDGSMSCSALSLLYAYKYISQKNKYLDMANEILEKHRVLELRGTDSRMYASSLRFWETMYETRDWGPSINSGHAWSLWTAEAKLLKAEITGDYQALHEAYCAFLATSSNIDANGGVRCCYTPDMLPGKPHTYDLYLEDRVEKGEIDLFETSTKFAQSQPKQTYSTSGLYTMIKSQEYWTRLGGVDFTNYTAINAILKDKTLQLDVYNKGSLFVNGTPSSEIEVIVPEGVSELILRMNEANAQVFNIKGCTWEVIEDGIRLTNIRDSFQIF